jgi:CubicO group peptidase (beta-lactamase class C family)
MSPILTRREMIRLTTAASVAGVGAPTANLFGAPNDPNWPTPTTWETRSLTDSGMNAAGIDDAVKYAAAHNSTGLVILRGGRIVTEQYWQGWNQDTAEPIFSSSKSLTSTLVGMAIEEGLIKGVNQSASDFVRSWKGTPKEAITIRHMLTMTSGIRVGAAAVSEKIDAFEETAALPLQHQPGEFWAYNTPVYRMLVHILEIASKQKIDDFTRRKLSGPLGITHSSWDCPPGPNGVTNCTWYRSGLRDMSRFGLLVVREGKWGSRQLISAKWLKEATTTSQKLNESYGYLWWLNGKPSYRLPAAASGVHEGMMWPDCPPDAFGALGAMDKKIYVVPSLDLVVSRHGPAAGVARAAGEGGAGSFDNQLLGRICRATKA